MKYGPAPLWLEPLVSDPSRDLVMTTAPTLRFTVLTP